MSKVDLKWAMDVTLAAHTLTLFMRGETQLNETQFEAHQDTLLEFLEETNNHRYRFGRTLPRSE